MNRPAAAVAARQTQTTNMGSVQTTNNATSRSTGDSNIVFAPDSQWAAAGAVVHLKGFAARVDPNDLCTCAAADALIRWIIECSPEVVVWDGDDHADDSFTALIPRIQKETDAKLAAFLLDGDRDRFASSWGSFGLQITGYCCPAGLDWSTLGVYALKTTGSKSVACFGGGATIKREWDTIIEDETYAGVKFGVCPICRPTADQNGVEPTSLAGCTDDRMLMLIEEPQENDVESEAAAPSA